VSLLAHTHRSPLTHSPALAHSSLATRTVQYFSLYALLMLDHQALVHHQALR
jgi:hypothetical protein